MVNSGLSLFFNCRYEFKYNHEEWINSVKPTLDPGISAQIYENLETSDTDIENCKSVRNEMRLAINSLLKVLLLAKFCLHYYYYYFGLRSMSYLLY